MAAGSFKNMKNRADLRSFLFTWGNVVRRARSLAELENHALLVRELAKCALTEKERLSIVKWVLPNIDWKRMILIAQRN